MTLVSLDYPFFIVPFVVGGYVVCKKTITMSNGDPEST